jgi:hypothetical protein
MTTENNKPVQIYKLGQMRASIWENYSADGKVSYTARFERSYRNSDGQWRNTQSFGLKDVLNLIQLSAQAAWFISFTRPGQLKEEAHWAELCEPEDL